METPSKRQVSLDKDIVRLVSNDEVQRAEQQMAGT